MSAQHIVHVQFSQARFPPFNYSLPHNIFSPPTGRSTTFSVLLPLLAAHTGLPESRLEYSSYWSPSYWSPIPAGTITVNILKSPIEILVAQQFPDASPAITKLLTDKIERIPIDRFDATSLSQTKYTSNTNTEELICITNCTDRNCEMKYQGEKMLPMAIRPNGDGVELRGEYSYHYNAASDEYATKVNTAREKRAADIAHCEKLLHDLPIALVNSTTTLAAHVEAVDCELSEMGAMLLEQKRIKQEIEARKKELEQLNASPVPQFDTWLFSLHSHRAHVVLPFGVSQLEGKLYQVLRIDQAVRDAVQTPAVQQVESTAFNWANQLGLGSVVLAAPSSSLSPSLS